MYYWLDKTKTSLISHHLTFKSHRTVCVAYFYFFPDYMCIFLITEISNSNNAHCIFPEANLSVKNVTDHLSENVALSRLSPLISTLICLQNLSLLLWRQYRRTCSLNAQWLYSTDSSDYQTSTGAWKSPDLPRWFTMSNGWSVCLPLSTCEQKFQ